MKGEALDNAAEDGNINEVTRLLGKKADINYIHKREDYGDTIAKTPLTAAVLGGHAEVVKFLINRKAYVNLAEPCNGLTALHLAASHENFPIIELLMSRGAKHDARDRDRDRDRDGWTPLHLAANNDNKQAEACLLDHGADANVMDDIGKTPLMAAAHDNHLPIVNLLLFRGADPNLVNTRS